jgi:hypothetical protein
MDRFSDRAAAAVFRPMGVSAAVGATRNFENNDTDDQNGVDSHLDPAASQFLSKSWQVGVVGYVYCHLTSDSGSGARLGSFNSKVAAIGPEVGCMFTLGGLQAYANVRGYRETWAENRVSGFGPQRRCRRMAGCARRLKRAGDLVVRRFLFTLR